MPFGFNPAQMAKKELLKVDLDKDKIPDVLEALDGAEAGCEFLANLFDDLDIEEAESILRLFDSLRKPEKRLSDAQLRAGAQKVVLIAPGLRAAKAAFEKLETNLKSS